MPRHVYIRVATRGHLLARTQHAHGNFPPIRLSVPLSLAKTIAISCWRQGHSSIIICQTWRGRYQMGRKVMRLKLRWQDADEFISAVHSQERVTGLTHDFYKYPARFSPQFSKAAISVFSRPSDLIVDPFVGGGTSLVEARSSGRLAIGTDISSLAHFVSRVKTRIYSSDDLGYFEQWFRRLPEKLNLRNEVKRRGLWEVSGYFRNLGCEQTWPIRKSLELGVQYASRVRDTKRQDFIRCVLLRSAQWALDGRKEIPTASQFRECISETSSRMIAGARAFARVAIKADRQSVANSKSRTICLHSKAVGVAKFIGDRGRAAPKLIVTSPPYPGVHIVYHRWQVRGRRETPAPFWIADKLDGSGEAYYLMNARRPGLNRYYEGIRETFSSLRAVSSRQTTLVQLLAFSDPKRQLPRYLDVMESSGYQECLLSEHLDSRDGRLWRQVPGRKWHAQNKGQLASSSEVVLIHKPV